MDARVYDDPDEFEATIGRTFAADPIRHTLALTVISRALHDPATKPLMVTVHKDGTLYGAAFRTPPWPLIASGLPADAATAAVGLLAELDPELPGVNGPRAEAEAFARAWAAHTRAGVHEAMAQRLFELRELRVPTVPGRVRLASQDDIPLLVCWRKAFQLEAIGHDRELDRAEEIIRASLVRGDRHQLWEDDGRTVAWAHAGVPAEGMTRVGPVYTPPEHRGRGYGSGVTAAVSQWARDAGAEHVLLFTDLANPTSNSIYQKIGYRPLFDTCEIEFTPAT